MASKLIRRLQDNRGKMHGHAKKNFQKNLLALPTTEVPTGIFFNEEIPDKILTDIPNTPTDVLSGLKKEEEDLSAEVMALEKEFETLKQSHRTSFGKLRELDDELDKLLETVEKIRSNYEEVVEEANKIGTEMNNKSVLIKDKKARLDTLREEIMERSKISIYVFDDGRIETPDNPDFLLNDDGYLDLKSQLIESEECLNLRIRDITTLARLLKISEKAERFNLVCENEEIEKAFWAFRSLLQ